MLRTVRFNPVARFRKSLGQRFQPAPHALRGLGVLVTRPQELRALQSGLAGGQRLLPEDRVVNVVPVQLGLPVDRESLGGLSYSDPVVMTCPMGSRRGPHDGMQLCWRAVSYTHLTL